MSLKKNHIKGMISSAACVAALSSTVFATETVTEFDKVYDAERSDVYTIVPINKDFFELTGLSELTHEKYEEFSQIPGFVPRSQFMARGMMSTPSVLPESVDNSQEIFFRPVFNQSGGSCGQASGIGYAFTYEMSRARNVSAALEENQFPTHYTWNHLNGGAGGGSWYYDGWQIIKDNGCPTVQTWGGMAGNDTRWLSGYDNYYAGLENVVSSYERINNVHTPEGLMLLKQWLHDAGDGSAIGGVTCFAAWISGSDYVDLPSGTKEAGKQMLTQWGSGGYHAMTIVGYDDSVRFDFNNDGSYTNDIDINGDNVVDMKDWEIGALKFANSWGSGWGDGGFSYMAYRAIAVKDKRGYSALTGNCAQLVRVETENSPKAVLRVEMEHESRNMLTISATVEQGNNFFTKEFRQTFNRKGGAHPMQGRNNSEPIELGLDVTSLLEAVDAGNVATFSLKVVESDYNAAADGNILSVSLMDYTGDKVKEYYSDNDNVVINNNGTTLVTVVRDTGDVVPEGEIRIQFMTNHMDDSVTQLMPNLRIYNEGRNDLDLADVTAEYYYTFEGAESAEVSGINWATIQPSDYNDITAKAHVRTLENGNSRTLQYWFSDDAGVLKPGEFVDIYSASRKADWTKYDQSNDYSFGAVNVFTDWTKIVGKIKGLTVWGSSQN